MIRWTGCERRKQGHGIVSKRGERRRAASERAMEFRIETVHEVGIRRCEPASHQSWLVCSCNIIPQASTEVLDLFASCTVRGE